MLTTARASGCAAAYEAATIPPSEKPTTAASAISRCSITASTSETASSQDHESPVERPCPRSSNSTTRWFASKCGRNDAKAYAVPRIPWRRRTGGRSPPWSRTARRAERVAISSSRISTHRAPPRPAGSHSPQRVDRRRRDDAVQPASQLHVQRDERVRLQLRERHVLGGVCLGPAELVGESPGVAPEHSVAEQADRHGLDAREPLLRLVRRELAAVHGLVQRRQRL